MDASGAIAAGLARLWVKFLPEIEARMAVLETAVNSLQAGQLTVSEREAAHAAAHKLAGVLGTFGLERGTELARLTEHRFEDRDKLVAAASEIGIWVQELRMLIEHRSQ